MNSIYELALIHDGCSDLVDQISRDPKFQQYLPVARRIEEATDLLLVDYQRSTIAHGKTQAS